MELVYLLSRPCDKAEVQADRRRPSVDDAPRAKQVRRSCSESSRPARDTERRQNRRVERDAGVVVGGMGSMWSTTCCDQSHSTGKTLASISPTGAGVSSCLKSSSSRFEYASFAIARSWIARPLLSNSVMSPALRRPSASPIRTLTQLRHVLARDDPGLLRPGRPRLFPLIPPAPSRRRRGGRGRAPR